MSAQPPWLPDNAQRCRNRQRHCTRSHLCARNLADIAQGSPVADFSRDIQWDATCKHFEPVRRRPEPEPVVREVKPWPVE